MQLRELLGDVAVLALRGDLGVEVVAVTHDSRRVVAGSCFACIPGATADGHDHAPAAVAAGAVALLVERPLRLGVTEVEVAGVRGAIGPVAAALEGYPSGTVRCLGVTGTNGKTTTTHLLRAVGEAAGERTGLVGTLGAFVDERPLSTGFTTPEAPDLQALLARMRDDGVRVVAMEVSSHALAQHRVDGTSFAAACFTNLSHEHLDYHGSLDAYFEAKAWLFEPSRAAGAALNVDDAAGVALTRRTRAAGLPTWTFAIDDPSADVVATGLAPGPAGTRFALHDRRGGHSAVVELALPGRFNVSNALAAAATALAAGLPFDAIATGLAAPLVVPGRLEPVGLGEPFTVLVDYAHTPDALDAVLRALRPATAGGRLVLVFGCGGDRDREKRPVMGRVAGAGADLCVLTSDNPRSEDPAAIAGEVLTGLAAAGAEPLVELDRRAAIRAALAVARPGDVVLIAGKGHETGQTAGGQTVPFDDRVVAREELEQLRCG